VPAVELSEQAQTVWDRLAPDLIEKHVLTSWDVDLFAAFCNATAMYYRAVEEMNGEPLEVTGSRNQPAVHPAFRVMEKAEAMMRATGQRFGLTPGDRANLKVDDNGPSSGAAAYVL
jgi:P27 family predicted phage terminase small subunit